MLGRPDTSKYQRKYCLRYLAAKNVITYCVTFVVRYAFRSCVGGPQKAYREARAAQPPPPELVNALIYRVTIKRVLAWHLEKTEDAIARVQVGVVMNQFLLV